MHRKIGLFLVSSTLAICCASARAQGPDDPPGIGGGDTSDAANLIKTRVTGGEGDPGFQEVGKNNAMLIGFRVQLDGAADNDVVKVVQPVFMSTRGHKFNGIIHGRVRGSEYRIFEARKGYAIGAITVQAGKGVDGFSIT
jgi:hypothetical protein